MSHILSLPTGAIPLITENPAVSSSMESRGSWAERHRAFLALLLLLRNVTSIDFIPYLAVHPGQRYGNVASEFETATLGTCGIKCVMQKPTPCYAFNYRETDRSCHLILDANGTLMEADGYRSFVQSESLPICIFRFRDVTQTTLFPYLGLCLKMHPKIPNANVSFEGWNGSYPAPAGGIVTFRCRHPNGFTDGAHLHTAECAPLDPDSWCFSFQEGEKVHVYPECRLTEKGREYIGRVNVTESGRGCLDWRDYPYGTPDDFNVTVEVKEFLESKSPFDPDRTPATNAAFEVHFLNLDSWSHQNFCRNPSGRDRPWCFVSDPAEQWEYCDIPTCTDPVPPECKTTQQGGEYVGRANATIAGDPCVPWKVAFGEIGVFLPAFPDGDRVDSEHNFCRNPIGAVAPFCYYRDDFDDFWERYCDIPFCDREVGAVGEGVHPECRLSERGKEYVGSKNETETGKGCLPWDSRLYDRRWDFRSFASEAFFVDGLFNALSGEYELPSHDRCRNPGSYRRRPWCFVSDVDAKWEYCDIPFCHDLAPPECKVSQRGAEYAGKKNVTISGYPCLNWLSIVEGNRPYSFSDELDGRHTFCRNPVGFLNGPACFISQMDWEYCDVPYCQFDDEERCDVRVDGQCVSPVECKTDAIGLSYTGTKNVTRYGHKCQAWMSNSPNNKVPIFEDYTDEQQILNPRESGDYYGTASFPDDVHPRHNFCRNPFGDEGGPCPLHPMGLTKLDPRRRRLYRRRPWCFVTDVDTNWEYCDIPFCHDFSSPEPANESDRKGGEYVGKRNVMISGFPYTNYREEERRPKKKLEFQHTSTSLDQHNLSLPTGAIPLITENPAVSSSMESRGSWAERHGAFLALLLLLRNVTSIDFIPYLAVHPGQRYGNVTSEFETATLGTRGIKCVMQKPTPCYAFNCRETDRSCHLILDANGTLLEADGYRSFVQNVTQTTLFPYLGLCLKKHPKIPNANVSFEGWNGSYPAPAGGTVTFRCRHPNGFTDGAHLHTAACAPLDPDSWCISFQEGAVECEKVHVYPECRLTEKGREYIGRVNVTESGRGCLDWRDYPYGTPDDFNVTVEVKEFLESKSPFDPDRTPATNAAFEVHFLNLDSWSHQNFCRNPSGRDRPWCFVSDPPAKQWEYCDIPTCTDTGKNPSLHFQPPVFLPAFPDGDRVDSEHNFCRNPIGAVAPFCYYRDDFDDFWERYCDIPFCDREVGAVGEGVHPECRLSERGKDYVGSKNETETGKGCLPWDSQLYDRRWDFRSFASEEFFVDGLFNALSGEYELPSHNRCRNPGSYRRRPWCFVSDVDAKWEYCDIPYCHALGPPECKVSQRGAEYAGKKNVTISGYPCLNWLSIVEGNRPYSFSDELDGRHTFCRNPVGFLNGPACFISVYLTLITLQGITVKLLLLATLQAQLPVTQSLIYFHRPAWL
ncbi:unnamed protein product [Darwinula stevensoni]|uniref:Kringle domain-containing protein n=1 Tax=Darwinula stevensoni TaxID=69355 RepID=A0A7R9A6H1_9CRUS|nr:unnamed protein product [Darwinula stevensoni]CAG0887793.1 unnamed protein product [Darwinula stevensoni]